tara:strand:+ start:22 stop:696 length:675 start_codon:yes stop_codon:yes gene_type:complete
MFGMMGGVIASAITESLIQLNSGKGYTQNLLNQSFMPVPLQKLNSLFNDGLSGLRYAMKDGVEADARVRLALMSIAQTLPVLQEATLRAAMNTYLPDAQMDKLMRRKIKRKINSGSNGGGSSSPVYFSHDGPGVNPGVGAAARNILPDELQIRDILSVLMGSPLQNLMGTEVGEFGPEAVEAPEATTPPPQPQAPQAAPEAPQQAPAVPTARGSNPSERLAEKL